MDLERIAGVREDSLEVEGMGGEEEEEEEDEEEEEEVWGCRPIRSLVIFSMSSSAHA